MTPMLQASCFLRPALLGDAAASGAMGLLMALGADALAPLLHLPAPLLRGAGLALLPYAAGLAWLGTRRPPRRGAVRAVIAANLLWATGSALLPLLGLVSPNAPGLAALLLQAFAVLGFAAAQWRAQRGTTHPFQPA
jgi:hypothetical protein